MSDCAFVTLATDDSYSLGALVLAHSLRRVGTVHQLVVLITKNVSGPMRDLLASVFNVVQEVNILDSKDEANLRLLKRPELGITFTKLHCWKLVQFSKCVFLDADTLVLENVDELFEREELSAAPDVGWPDCFNSGVFVYKPSNETYENLITFALERGSFDGGDQGLLNLYFSDWAHTDIRKHLPFIYNMCSTACYSYLPAFKQFGANVKIVHFIGPAKPWLQYFDTETRQVRPSPDLYHLQTVLQRWWDTFCSQVHPGLSADMATSRSTGVHYLISNSSKFIKDEEEFNKIDFRNVWDPWEQYEQNNSDQFENSAHISNNINVNITENVMSFDKHQNSNVETYDSNIRIANLDSSSEGSKSFPETSSNVSKLFCNLSNSNISNVSIVSSNPLNIHQETVKNFEGNCDSNKNFEGVQSFNENHVYSSKSSEIFHPHVSSTYVSRTHVSNPHDHDLSKQNAQPNASEPSYIVANENALQTASESNITANASLAGAFAQFTLGAPRSASQIALENHLRRQGWEVGNIDYMGRDSFDNIWSKIAETLSTVPPPPEAPKARETTQSAPTEKNEEEAKQKTRKSPPKIQEQAAVVVDKTVEETQAVPGPTLQQTPEPTPSKPEVPIQDVTKTETKQEVPAVSGQEIPASSVEKTAAQETKEPISAEATVATAPSQPEKEVPSQPNKEEVPLQEAAPAQAAVPTQPMEAPTATETPLQPVQEVVPPKSEDGVQPAQEAVCPIKQEASAQPTAPLKPIVPPQSIVLPQPVASPQTEVPLQSGAPLQSEAPSQPTKEAADSPQPSKEADAPVKQETTPEAAQEAVPSVKQDDAQQPVAQTPQPVKEAPEITKQEATKAVKEEATQPPKTEAPQPAKEVAPELTKQEAAAPQAAKQEAQETAKGAQKTKAEQSKAQEAKQPASPTTAAPVPPPRKEGGSSKKGGKGKK